MNIQNIINSRIGVGSALLFGQLMPPFFGYPFAGGVAKVLAGRKQSSLTISMRLNQWVVHDGNLNSNQLDEVVRNVFQNSSKAIYDLYHNLHNPKTINRMVEYTDRFNFLARFIGKDGRGLIATAPHIGSFDIGGLALAVRKVDFQTLSYPNPGDGYQMQNYFRERYGLNITPMSISSMQAAEERLKAGGMVLTGLDRPLPSSKYRPLFFNRPTHLPVSYIPMAIKVGVPVAVVCCYHENGSYYLDASEPVEMVARADRQEEIEINAGMVLKKAETMIRAHPDQWFMYYPLWPELAGIIN